MVTIFGAALTFTVPLLGTAPDLAPHEVGIWVGAGIHEVAQVVVAASFVGGTTALAAATTVELGGWLSSWSPTSRRSAGTRSAPATAPRSGWGPSCPGSSSASSSWPRAVRMPIPDGALTVITLVGTFLLAAGMFGLGLDIRLRTLPAAVGRGGALGRLDRHGPAGALALILVL